MSTKAICTGNAFIVVADNTPNNYGNQDCVEVYSDYYNRSWNDISCGASYTFVCKYTLSGEKHIYCSIVCVYKSIATLKQHLLPSNLLSHPPFSSFIVTFCCFSYFPFYIFSCYYFVCRHFAAASVLFAFSQSSSLFVLLFFCLFSSSSSFTSSTYSSFSSSSFLLLLARCCLLLYTLTLK